MLPSLPEPEFCLHLGSGALVGLMQQLIEPSARLLTSCVGLHRALLLDFGSDVKNPK